MIKTLIRAMYSALISIVLISIILAGWTGYAFISQSKKSSEIINVIQDMYESQKSVIIDVIDLSKILIKDTSERISNENNNPLAESELLTDLQDKSQLDSSLIVEDNSDNPLGIVIEQSLPELGDKTLPEISEKPLVNDQSEYLMNRMEMDMN